MRIVQFTNDGDQRTRLGAVVDDRVVDLTSAPDGPRTLHELYYTWEGFREGFESVVAGLIGQANQSYNANDLLASDGSGDRPRLEASVTPPDENPLGVRIWLAGVTHQDSARLREIEAKQTTGDSVNVYEQKYRECSEGGIPELFAKMDAHALRGHCGTISRPADTVRLVPETELVTIYGLNSSGQVERIGYTGGNDYTDNGIEAANPLNLPQAKNWEDGCASLGPVLITDSAFDDSEITVSCEIVRDGSRVGFREGQTGQQHLNMPDGLFHLERALFSRLPLPPNTIQILYWGTPIVFANEDLAGGLLDGDIVRMEFGGGIGRLENRIVDLAEPRQLGWLRENHERFALPE